MHVKFQQIHMLEVFHCLNDMVERWELHTEIDWSLVRHTRDQIGEVSEETDKVLCDLVTSTDEQPQIEIDVKFVYKATVFNSGCVTHLTFLSNYFFFLIRYDAKDPEVCSSAFEMDLFDQLPKI